MYASLKQPRLNQKFKEKTSRSARDRTEKYVGDCNVIKNIFSSIPRATTQPTRSSFFPRACCRSLGHLKGAIALTRICPPMQTRNVSMEDGSKRYGNMNRVTAPTAVSLRYTDVGKIATTLEEESRVNSPGEDFPLANQQPLAVTCQPTRLSTNIYVVDVTTRAVITTTMHAIL